MLIAGAGIKSDAIAANLTIWFGVTVFSWVMQKLVANQQNSVAVIKQGVQLRIDIVAAQPSDISSRVIPLFSDLQNRLALQHTTLKKIGYAVWVVWLAVSAVAINAQWPNVFPDFGTWLLNGAKHVGASLVQFFGVRS